MKARILILLLCAMVFSVGCSSEYEYKPPTTRPVLNNSITVNKSKDDVWKEIVPALGKTFFVINNLDKESGLINISYGGDPEKYIDCGHIHSYVKNLAGARTYDFPASKAYQRYEVMGNEGLGQIIRKMDLEGRMNIIIEEVNANQTKVTANTRYVVTKIVDVTAIGTGYVTKHNDTITFNSGQRGTFPQGTFCQCNGNFEQEVLSLLLSSNTSNVGTPETDTFGRKIVGYRVDTSSKGSDGQFLKVPVYEDGN